METGDRREAAYCFRTTDCPTNPDICPHNRSHFRRVEGTTTYSNLNTYFIVREHTSNRSTHTHRTASCVDTHPAWGVFRHVVIDQRDYFGCSPQSSKSQQGERCSIKQLGLSALRLRHKNCASAQRETFYRL